MKNKSIDKWLDEIIKKINNSKGEAGTIDIDDNNDEEDRINMNILFTDTNFPKLEFDHHILGEKGNDFNFVVITNNDAIEKKIKKKTNSKKGKNESITSYDSIILLKRLQEDIRSVEI